MKSHASKTASVLLGAIALIAVSACQSTARGVVRDTQRNTEKIGKGVKHVGERIEDSVR